MIYEGYIKSVSDRYEYKVTIEYNDNTNNTKEIILADNDPIVITYESEDNPFAPIKTYSCTLNIVNRDYLFDLYSSTFDRVVKVYDGSDNILFRGYVTPDIYNQDWEHTSVISIECISPVAMLKYKDYQTNNRQLVSLDALVNRLMNLTSYTGATTFYPKNLYVKYADENGEEQKIINPNGDYVVDDLYIDEANFFDDDEEQTPWKWYEVIEEVCKYMAWQLIEYNNCLYFIPIDHIFYNPIPSLNYNWDVEANIYPYLGYITKDSYASNSNNISLQQTYRKIKVIANTYPYEEVIPDIFDTSNLVFAYNGSPSMNNLDIPALRWTSDTKQGEYVFYWLYCKSKNIGTDESPRYIIHPNLYDIVFINNVPNLRPVTIYGEQDRYIKSFNSDQEYMAAMAGISVLRATNYNVKESTVNSSLSWNNQITLHHAFNNSGMKLSRTTAEEFESKQLMWRNYLLNNINYGDKWLASVDSSKVITVKKGNYLVLSGKGMISNTGFEDPSITEWKGTKDAEKKKFETANAYKVIDVGSEDRNKEYVGFPLFNIGLEVGDITIGGRVCIAMYQYKKKAKYDDQHNPTGYGDDDYNYKITDVIYKWVANGDLPYVMYEGRPQYMKDSLGNLAYVDFTNNNYYRGSTDWKGYEYNIKEQQFIWYDYLVKATSVIKIPVGTNTFSFYRWYDITNTCDWRMGLDNAKGFAIPVDHNLSGVATVKFYGMDDSLIDYPDEVTSLSCFQSDGADVIVNPNPGWKQGYIWDTFEIKQYYKGSFPNYILLANLSLTINEQTYFSFTDLAFKNENNKGTDHEYSNIIDNTAITDYDNIELKINTQDEAKYRSFSSMMTQVSGTNYYITKMAKQDELEYKIQEENIIDIYKDYYSTPRVLFDCDLKDRVTGSFYHSVSGSNYTFDTISPFTYMYHPRTQKIYGVNGFTRKLFDESAECKLYEANVAPWFFTYDGITPIRRAQASQFMPFNEPYLLNPYNLTGTYYSSATGIADVNPETGEVTIHGGGTVEIGISGTAGSTSYELDIDRLDPQISWSTGSYSTTLISGSPTGQPYLLNPNNVSPITYWSTDESKAVVDDEGGIGVVGVGGCSIFASFSGSAEYYPASVKYDLTITKGERIDPNLSFATDSASVTFDDTYYLPNTLNNPYNVPITVSISPYIVDAYVIDGQLWVEQNLATGTTTITASFDGDDYYLSGSASYDLTVEKGNPNLSWSSSYYDATISGTNDFPTLSNPHNLGPIDIWSSDWNIATISATGTINLVSTGSCGITAYYAGDDNWNAEGVYYTLNVTDKLDPNLSWSSNSYIATISGTNSFPTLSNPNNVSPITYSSSDTNKATIDNYGNVTIINAGICNITASFAGDNTYISSSSTYQLRVKDPMYESEYFTIEPLEDSTITFSDQSSWSSDPYLKYSTDKITWNNLDIGIQLSVTQGQKVYIKGTKSYHFDYDKLGHFKVTGNYNISGNIMSLIYDDNFIGKTSFIDISSSYSKAYIFSTLFLNETTLISAYNLVLPIDNVIRSTYESMFRGCTSLIYAPELSAGYWLSEYAYENMFKGCTSLIYAPSILPSTHFNHGCYSSMFEGCTSLTTAPELPATALNGLGANSTADGCYSSMFKDCTSLKIAPELPATILAYGCYTNMFYGCTSLTSAPQLPATTLKDRNGDDAARCYWSMFYGCTSLTTAPELPATTLVDSCYYRMFVNCTSLNYVKCIAINNINQSGSTVDWLANVALTGTFVKNPNTSSWTTGSYGIPANWTVQNA